MSRNGRKRPGALTGTRRRTPLSPAVPWVAILLLTGGFHVLRGAWVDAVIFLGAGALLAADAAGLFRILSSGIRGVTAAGHHAIPGGPARGAVAGGVWCVLVLAPRYSAADAVALGAMGLLLVPLVWRETEPAPWRQPEFESQPSSERRGRHPDARGTLPMSSAALRRASILWSAVAVAGSGWELSSYFLGLPSAAAANAHPALSDLVGPLLDASPTRAICALLWLLGGYALLRRGREA